MSNSIKKQSIHVRPEVHRRASIAAALEGRTIQDVAEEAILASADVLIRSHGVHLVTDTPAHYEYEIAGEKSHEPEQVAA